MPVVISECSFRITDSEKQKGHSKGRCYGAKDWETSDGKVMGSGFYLVKGVEMLDWTGQSVAEGWWCETCCRERGWIW
jgi:hypothetical protein